MAAGGKTSWGNFSATGPTTHLLRLVVSVGLDKAVGVQLRCCLHGMVLVVHLDTRWNLYWLLEEVVGMQHSVLCVLVYLAAAMPQLISCCCCCCCFFRWNLKGVAPAPESGTSHCSIVDEERNAVSITSSVSDSK
jgi:hypothetical protein